MTRPLLLDLFCGAGGCSVGYHRAGFDVVGVDIKPQPRYPFPLLQNDAMTILNALCAGMAVGRDFPYWLSSFAAIHASPPCQAYSRATAWRGRREDHPDLIAATRVLLVRTGLPYVIENVEDARPMLQHPVMLCGSMFGLRVRRRRYFEAPCLPLRLVPPCQHRRSDYSHDHGGKQTETRYRDAMECEWMTVQESRQAIPPAFTEFLGKQLLAVCEARSAS